MPEHTRQSHRLRDYDYTREGAYFVTICTYQRAHLFGQITDGVMELNPRGQIAFEEWVQTAVLLPNVTVPVFVVMPNHIHAIIVIGELNGSNGDNRRGLARQSPAPPAPGLLQSPASNLQGLFPRTPAKG